MKRNNVFYIGAMTAALCGVVYLSLPSESTLVEMSRDDVDVERTERLLRQRVSRDPDSVEAAIALSDFLLERRRTEESADVLAAIHASRPDDDGVRERYGMALLLDGRIGEAMAVVPGESRSRTFLLTAVAGYEQRGDIEQAEAMLLKAEEGFPEDAGVWKRIARWRWDMHKTEGAADALRRALRLRPDDEEALEAYYTNRVWQLDAPGGIGAAAALEKVKPLGRAHLNALYSLQMAVRDLDGATETLRKLALLPGAPPEATLTYGTFLQEKGDAALGDAVLLAFASTPGLPRPLLTDAASRLERSAVARGDLALARRLAGLTDIPGIIDSARMVAIDIAMERERFDVAAELVGAMLEDPAATADMLETGLELAYRTDDIAAIAALHGRIARAGVSIDQLAAALPPDDRPLASWSVAPGPAPGKAYAMAGWLKTALALSAAPDAAERPPASEIAAVTEQLLPLVDQRAALVVAAAAEALVHLSEVLPDEAAQRLSLERAAALMDGAEDSPLSGSAAFLLAAAGVNERLGRPEAAEAYWRRAVLAGADDSWSRLGLARAAAAKGDPAPVEAALRHFAEREGEKTADEARDLVFSCLTLADTLREGDPEASARWLERARAFAGENAALLDDGDREHLVLLAELAERGGDAEGALSAWEAVASREPGSLRSLLGLSRANILLHRPDAAWEQLEQLEPLLAENSAEERIQLAWQFLAVADETPADTPEGRERRARAMERAEAALAAHWDADLSLALFWRALDAGDLPGAKRHAARRTDVPDIQAALAEALLAAGDGEGARVAARAAGTSRDRAVLLRMAYVFSQLGEEGEAKALLARVESAGGEETPEFLLQLADAHGAVGNFEKQYALAEKRARAGGVPEWLDAVDRRTWAGDVEGGLKALAEARKLHPDSVELADRALSLLADANRPGEATETFAAASRAIDGLEEKLSADALAAIAVSYDDLRSTPRARRYFRLSLEKDAANKRGLMGFARLLVREGSLSAALLRLRLYVEGTPEDPWGWLELANTRAAANQNARADYRRVVALTESGGGGVPRDVRAARAVALRALGREKEALQLLRSSVGAAIDDPNIACDYAQMLMDTGRYEEAERILRETAAAFPHHVWAYRLESTILVRRRKYDLAVERLREALTWAPHDGEAQRDLGFAAQLWERVWDAQKGWLTAGGR